MDLYNIGSIVKVKPLKEILYLKTNLPLRYYKYCDRVGYVVKVITLGKSESYYHLNITQDFSWKEKELNLVDSCNSFIDLNCILK